MITIASLSFAEIKFTGGWGDVEFRALESLGANTDLVTDLSNSWGGSGTYGLTLQAKGDKGGLFAGVQIDPSTKAFAASDNLYIWMKPVDGLQVAIGSKYVNGDLRVHSEDDIFTQFNTAGKPAIGVTFTGIQNLYVAATVQTVINSYYPITTSALTSTYASAQVGADYTISGFGRIRAQYIGDGDTTNTNNGSVEVAVLTNGLVKGLAVEFGAKAQLVADAVYNANLYVSYADGPFWMEAKAYNKISTAAGTEFYGKYYADANYNISGPYTAGFQGEDDFTANTSNKITAKPYFQVKHGLDNGFVVGKVYFQYEYTSYTAAGSTAASAWKVPVYLEYCFW